MVFRSLILRKARIYFHYFWLTLNCLLLLGFLSFYFLEICSSLRKALYASFALRMADWGFVLNNVIVNGRVNLPKDAPYSFVNYSVGTFIYDLDLDAIRKKARFNPWIKNCVVKRQLPNTLCIQITEYSPIAIWQYNYNHHLIDKDGHCIVVEDFHSERFKNLLNVVGKGANLYAHQLIGYMNTDPSLKDKVSAAVRYGERRWNLILNDIVVKMPEQDFLDAWLYLVNMHKKQKLFDCKIRSIDLRNANKFYVEYK